MREAVEDSDASTWGSSGARLWLDKEGFMLEWGCSVEGVFLLAGLRLWDGVSSFLVGLRCLWWTGLLLQGIVWALWPLLLRNSWREMLSRELESCFCLGSGRS
jgi:hypothetical protein